MIVLYCAFQYALLTRLSLYMCSSLLLLLYDKLTKSMHLHV